MKFRNFLQERVVNYREFVPLLKRLGTTALIGFEVETILPQRFITSLQLSPPGGDPAEIQVKDLETLEELAEFFHVGRWLHRDESAKFDRWRLAKRNDWVDENWREYDEPYAEDERAAREKAKSAYDDQRDTWETFWDEEYGGLSEFIVHHDIEPLYGWVELPRRRNPGSVLAQGGAPSEEKIQKALASKLKDQLGILATVDGKSPTAPTDPWKITDDNSIRGELMEMGVEIISPPLPPEQAFKKLESLFEFMKVQGLKTNHSTGLHINISLPDLANRLDPLKLVLFMGEERALKIFDRLDNNYTRPQLQQLQRALEIGRNNLVTGKSFSWGPNLQRLKDFLHAALSLDKTFSVNLGKLEKGYLEFRAAGGVDYHKRPIDIKRTMLSFLSAVEIACDPELEKNAYYKKLSKLMNLAFEPHELDILAGKLKKKEKTTE